LEVLSEMNPNDFAFLAEAVEYTEHKYDVDPKEVLRAFESSGVRMLRANLQHLVNQSIEVPEGSIVKLLAKWSKERVQPPLLAAPSPHSADSSSDDEGDDHSGDNNDMSEEIPGEKPPLPASNTNVKTEETSGPTPPPGNTATTTPQADDNPLSSPEAKEDEKMEQTPEPGQHKRELSKTLIFKKKPESTAGNAFHPTPHSDPVYFELRTRTSRNVTMN